MRRTETGNHKGLATFIRTVSKPLNVYFLETLCKLKPFNKLSPFVIGLIVPIIISIIGSPWIVIGINQGPKSPIVYIYGYFAVAGTAYFAFMGTYLLYRRSSERLQKMGQYLKIKVPPNHLDKWYISFAFRWQLFISFLIAILIAVFIGYVAISFDKTNSITVTSATFGGFITGFIIGSGIHYFVNFPSIAARFYLSNMSEVYKIIPSETSGLTYLFRITVDFMFIGSSVGTLSLIVSILFLINAGSYRQNITFLPAILIAIFIVVVALIMLFRSLIIFAEYTQGEKNQTLSEIQSLINKKYNDINKGNLKAENFDEINRLANLYNRVKSTSTWPLDLSALRGILASIIVPFLPTIVDISINWLSQVRQP